MNSDQIWRAIEHRVLRAIGGYKPGGLVFPEPGIYTPAWTSSGTAPTLGDGDLTGRYVLHGKICFTVIKLVWGSTTSGGTGNWSLSIPFPAANQGFSYYGLIHVRDAALASWMRLAQIAAGASVIGFQPGLVEGSNDNNLTATNPFTPNAGDSYSIQVVYERS